MAAQHPRLRPVGTLDPRRYVGWRDDLQTCVEGGCVAIRFALGVQHWSPDTLLFEKMVEAVGETGLPIIVDFNGTGWTAGEWMRKVAAVAHRYNAPIIMNEVSYAFTGELITVMHEYPNVYAAIRWLCLADGLETMVGEGLAERLMYGSNAPQFSVRALRNQVLMAKISASRLLIRS